MEEGMINLEQRDWFDSTPQTIVYSYEIYDYLVRTQKFVWVRKWIEKHTKDRFNLIVDSNINKVKDDSELLHSLYALEDATGYKRNAIRKAIGKLQHE